MHWAVQYWRWWTMTSAPVHLNNISLNCLDVIWVVWVYLLSTSSFRETDSLSFWLDAGWVPTFLGGLGRPSFKAYGLKDWFSTFPGKAHFTRAVMSLWVFWHQAYVSHVCKAAIWSSVNTFSKFYQIDNFASSEDSFRRSCFFWLCCPPPSVGLLLDVQKLFILSLSLTEWERK